MVHDGFADLAGALRQFGHQCAPWVDWFNGGLVWAPRDGVGEVVGDVMSPGGDRQRGRRADGGGQRRGVSDEQSWVAVDFAAVIHHPVPGVGAQARPTPGVHRQWLSAT